MAKVLVVDDNATNRELIMTLLRYKGHRSLEAADGSEALTLVRQERPDLVICDILMPTMDGYEFVRQLRADPKIAHTEVIFYTAYYREQEARNLAKDCGVSRVLIKPCVPEDILEVIEQALAHENPIEVAPVTEEFDREHLRLMTDMLSEKADKLESTNQRLSALTDLNLRLASEHDPHALLDQVCKGARDLIGAKYAVLSVSDKNDGKEVYSTNSGIDATVAGNLIPPRIDNDVLGSVVSERKPRRFANPDGEARSAGLPPGYPTAKSVLACPIVSLSTTYGWIALFGKLGADEFSEEDERILSIHAAQVGRIYENGSLYVQVQRHAAQLQDSELRFRQLAENIREVFFLVTADFTRILYVSPAYEAVWGRSCESLYAQPQSWMDSIHRDDLEAVLRGNEERTETGGINYEYRIVRQDGSLRWISARGFPIRNEAGEIYRIAGIAEDITERKQAADELRESERRFSDMLGNLQLVSLMLDGEARITYCNEYLLGLTGWQHEEVIGRNWFELFIPPENNDLKDDFAALLANLPEARHHENEILTRSGERRLIHWNNSVLQSGVGDVIGTASIGEDITDRKRAEQALVQLRRRSELILESIGEGIHGIDMEGRIIFENPAAAKLLGYSIEELSGRPAHATMHHSRKDGKPYPIAQCPIHATMHDGATRRIEDEVFWRNDGSSFPVEYTTAPMRNERDDVIGAVVAFRDITDRKEAETRIIRLNRVYAVLSGINSMIVRVRTRDELFRETCRVAVDHGRFLLAWVGAVDPASDEIRAVAWAGEDDGFAQSIRFPLSEDNLVARAMRSQQAVVCNDIEGDPRTLIYRDEMLQRGYRSLATLPISVDGKLVGVVGLCADERDYFDNAEMRLLVELAGDIAFALDHIAKEEKLDYLAFYDPLTGVPNRNLFRERLAQQVGAAAREQRQLAVVLLDTERFNTINDTLGRQAGDELLKQIAASYASFAADAGLFARLVGDQFAVVIPDVRIEDDVARIVEQGNREVFGASYQVGDTKLRVSAKFGIAVFPGDGTDADTLLKNAEAALKRAKETGERYLFYTQQMSERVAGKLSLENKLRHALENNEFVLHYQPKVDVETRLIVGVEALMRWQSPDLGLVPPLRFIPLLEETGMILDVGAWALRRAALDHQQWLGQNLVAPRVAVNVSAIQLRHRDFIAVVKEALREGADPPAVDIEITESVIMVDLAATVDKFRVIRDMGLNIAIDDFGTGYSSLGYLAKLPVHSLKIDRSFIITMTDDPDTMTLVSTIISLAHSLRLKVCAEGVETEEQAKALRLLRCDEMQGYLISRPVPVEELTLLLTPSDAQ